MASDEAAHAQALARLRAAPAARLFLDYDGTLVDIVAQPELAVVDDDLRALLLALCGRPRTEVAIVSGRPRPWLAAQLATLPLTLCAEHGLWLRRAGDDWRMLAEASFDRRAVVRAMEEATQRHPGARFEEKDRAAAFHYRNAVIDDDTLAALKAAFAAAAGPAALMLDGNCVIEIVPRGVSKALAVQALKQEGEDVVVFAAGDDTTDLALLNAIPDDALAATVGERLPPRALHFDHPASLRTFLRGLL